MTDDALPHLSLGLGDGNAPIVYVDDERIATDLADLLRTAPGAVQPAGAGPLAHAVNHFAQGSAFAVIDDPDGFAAQYRKTLAAEDPNAPWQEGVVRLSDYGVPDFDEIAAPTLTGRTLVFCAVDTFLGLPYRVSVDLSAGRAPTDDDYRALDLQPVAADPAADTPRELSEEDRAFLASLATTGGPQG